MVVLTFTTRQQVAYLYVESRQHPRDIAINEGVHLADFVMAGWLAPVFDEKSLPPASARPFGCIPIARLEAMLYDLQRRDISDFNVRQVPQTDALADQKVHTLRGPMRWLRACLEERRVTYWDNRELHNVDWDDGNVELPKRAAFDAYKRR